jgi:MerR family mercuric resistance operon transcriptional regulator
MTIGELARQAGVGVETVRYYQRRNLISEPPRRTRGFREYTEETLRTLRFIRRAKGLGFTLKEIQQLLVMRAGGRKTQRKLIEVIADKQADLERRAHSLEVTIRALRRLGEEIRRLPASDGWTVLEPDSAHDAHDADDAHDA